LQKVYKEGRVKVNEEEFFLKLVDVSSGPTVERWRSDGYNGERVTNMMRTLKEREGERYVTREEYNNFRAFSSSEAREYEGEGEVRSNNVNNNNNANRETGSEQSGGEDESKCKVHHSIFFSFFFLFSFFFTKINPRYVSKMI
jgi:hypothetical protein